MLQSLVYIRFDPRLSLDLFWAVATNHLQSLLKVRTNGLRVNVIVGFELCKDV